MSELLSIVVLTKDEAANIADCLDAVLAQLRRGDEVIVVDSASKDETVSLAERYCYQHAGVVRMHAFPENVTFGAARHTGVDMARHDLVVFLSADATPEKGWLDALRDAAENADVVYGRQRHAPPRQDVVTVSRGLRYHHFENPGDGLPERFASNVNAAYRKYAFQQVQFDEELAGSEDVAFAKQARLAGLRIAYAPTAVVGHKDVATWRGEWRKHKREGAAHAQLRTVLGAPKAHIAWAVLVAGMMLIALVGHSLWMLVAATMVFFAPTMRRVFSPVAKRYKTLPLVGGALASPVFDMAFVISFIARAISNVTRPRRQLA